MTTRERIKRAVDNDGWQILRRSLKGTTTEHKLATLKRYYVANVLDGFKENSQEDVEIRIDNYIKALCRGGQLYPGESLQTALMSDPMFNLKVRRQ